MDPTKKNDKRVFQLDAIELQRLANTPYLTELDFRIIEDLCSGVEIANLAKKFKMRRREIQVIYQNALERLRHLNSLMNPAKQKDPEDRYVRMLRRLGFQFFYPGVRELEVAVLLAAERPELLDSMQEGLYPEAARILGITCTDAQVKIRKAIEDRRVFYRRSETHPDFYDTKGILDRRINVKHFLQTLLLYTENHVETKA